MGRTVAVEYRHLNVHQDDIGLGFASGRGCNEVIESLPTVPNGGNRETILLDGFESNLLINGTADGQHDVNLH